MSSAKFAIIGLGFISKRHLDAMKELGELVCTCDIDPEKKADFTHWKAMFESEEFKKVTHVAICTPNYLHPRMIRAALAQGKQVLSEKPLAIHPSELDGLDGVNVVLQLRYNPKVKLMRDKILASGKTNHNIDITVKTYREKKYWDSWKGNPEESGGILYNMGIHYLDLLIYLLGAPTGIVTSEYSLKKAKGLIKFERGVASFHIELLTEEAPVTRKLTVDGHEFDIEGATIPLTDSGEYTNLHTEVYKAFLNGEGLTLHDASPSLFLAEELKKHGL